VRKSLESKVIVITGASSGFGKGAALELARRGATLVLAARRKSALSEVELGCIASGSQALVVQTDVSKAVEMEHLAAQAIEKFGRIDVWINNAGGAAVGFFTDVPLVDHIQVIETDLMGTIYGSYAAIKQFLLQGSGTVINIASMIGKIPAPYYASYAAAKHGVVGLSAALRQELSSQNISHIHVSTVMPMAMDTPFFEHAANYTGHETVPIPPLNDAQKVIDLIVELAIHPRDEEIPVGLGASSNLIMHNTAPTVSEKLMAKLTHQVQMKDAPVAAQTDGTLRQTEVDGNDNGKGRKFA